MGNAISTKAALERLGTTNRERAQKLSMSLRGYQDLKKALETGNLPIWVKRLLNNPVVLEGMLDDARAGRTNGNHHDDQAA